MQKVLIIDPECRFAHGHYLPTTRSLLSAFADSRRFVAIHRKASPLIVFDDDVTVWKWPDVRTLSRRIFRQVEHTAYYRSVVMSRDAKAMLQFARRAKMDAGDVIIFHSAWPDQAKSLAQFARQLGPEGASLHVRLIGEIRNEQLRSEDEAGLSSFARALDELPNLHLYTETIEMSAELEACHGFPPARQWLTPMNIRQGGIPSAKDAAADCFVVGMLGGKRKEQGIELIPDIIRLLAERLREEEAPGRMRVLIQKPGGLSNGAAGSGEARRFMASLMAFDASDVLELELLEPELDATAFADAIDRSHVLVLPYDIHSYRSRGSGLIIEAAMSGTPAIVARGFAMADWQEMAGSPTATSIAEYVEAVLTVARDYQRYRDGAVRAGQAMHRAMAERIVEIRAGGH